MLIVMKADASRADVDAVEDRCERSGSRPTRFRAPRAWPSASPATRAPLDPGLFARPAGRRRRGAGLQAVEAGVARGEARRHVSRHRRPRASAAAIRVIAGPCSVERREQIIGSRRGGARRRARTCCAAARSSRAPSPYAFQGMKGDGLKLSGRGARGDRPAGRHRGDGHARRRAGGRATPTSSRSARATCRTSRCSRRWVRCASRYAQARPVGDHPGVPDGGRVHRRPAATTQVILCERGIRTFETMTRNTLDLGSIPLIKRLTHLPDHRRPLARHGRLARRCRRWRGRRWRWGPTG